MTTNETLIRFTIDRTISYAIHQIDDTLFNWY